jgi:hypothetical protein
LRPMMSSAARGQEEVHGEKGADLSGRPTPRAAGQLCARGGARVLRRGAAVLFTASPTPRPPRRGPRPPPPRSWRARPGARGGMAKMAQLMAYLRGPGRLRRRRGAGAPGRRCGSRRRASSRPAIRPRRRRGSRRAARDDLRHLGRHADGGGVAGAGCTRRPPARARAWR